MDLNEDTNMLNIECLGMMTLMCNKQEVSNIWSSIHEKVNPFVTNTPLYLPPEKRKVALGTNGLSNSEVEPKKSLLIK